MTPIQHYLKRKEKALKRQAIREGARKVVRMLEEIEQERAARACAGGPLT